MYGIDNIYGLKSFGPMFEDIQDVTTSTSRSRSLDTSARRIFESTPNVFPTSFATVSQGVPAVRLVKSSLPLFTASAIAGGMSGRPYK